MKKTLSIIFVLTIVLSVALMLKAPAYASVSKPPKQTKSSVCPKPTFFGLLPWYQYLHTYVDNNPNLGQPQCEVCFDVLGNETLSQCPDNSASDISLVLLAIVNDLLRVAGLIAVGMVLYSSVKFITSQGEPEDVKQARSAIINALIGAAIALFAIVIVSYLGGALGG